MNQRYAAPILFFVVPALLCAQGGRLEPVEESGRDPALSIFLNDLRNAVRQRDAAALLRMTTPNIQNGFGCADGLEEFQNIWKPRQSASKV